MLNTIHAIGEVLFYFLGPLLVIGFTLNYGLQNPNTGLGKWVYRWWPFAMSKKVKAKLKDQELADKRALAEVTAVKLKEDLLMESAVGSVLTILGEQLSIKGHILLLSLQFFGTDKNNKVHIDPGTKLPLAEYPWITLDGGDVIARLPDKESGNERWFYLTEVTDQAEVPAKEYLREYGKKFADSLQSARVTFTYPGLGDRKWRCTNIVWADCQVKGKNRFGSASGTMTRVSMLLSKDDKSGEFLLFVLLRGGSGNDGLYTLREFDPEVEIEDIL